MNHGIDQYDLFICYPPGARGDFLASVLKDDIVLHYMDYAVQRPKNYKKIHWASDLPESPDPSSTNIRIKLNTYNDLLTVAYLWHSKIDSYPTIEKILEDLVENELACRQRDYLFDHVVNFEDVFSIEYLDWLHHVVVGPAIPFYMIPLIQHNISLQPRVTVNNFRAVWPDLNIDRIMHLHPLG